MFASIRYHAKELKKKSLTFKYAKFQKSQGFVWVIAKKIEKLENFGCDL